MVKKKKIVKKAGNIKELRESGAFQKFLDSHRFADLTQATVATVNSLRHVYLVQDRDALILSLESFIDRLKRFDKEI